MCTGLVLDLKRFLGEFSLLDWILDLFQTEKTAYSRQVMGNLVIQCLELRLIYDCDLNVDHYSQHMLGSFRFVESATKD